MKRSYPLYFDEYYRIAKAANFSCPKGRALYACNRQQMGWPLYSDENVICVPRSPLWLLSHCKLETAQRWLRHWNNGGHIRSLHHTVEEWNAQRREDDKRRREFYKRLDMRTEEQRRKDHDDLMKSLDLLNRS